MLKDMRINNFLSKTASGDPIPGGGSVSALAAAAATALSEMVAKLTLGRKKYEAHWPEIQEIVDESSRLRNQFLTDIDGDAEAYNEVFSAYKLPQTSDDAKQLRNTKIQDGLKSAANVPLDVARKALRVLWLAKELIEKGNVNAITDGAVAAMLARSSVLGAAYNVRINLAAIQDEDYKQAVYKEVEYLEAQAMKIEKEALDLIDL